MNIVFDFGGVLLHWQPHEFMPRLLPDHAATADAAAALVANFFQGFGGDWGDFDRGTVEPAPLAARIAARTGLSVADATLVIDAIPQELQPITATVSLLSRLRDRGHALFFLSNMPEPYAAHLEATHGFFGHFKGGVFSARIGLIKPEPAIYAHAVDVFGIEPAETVFIDDIEKNVVAAQAAGWQAFRFENPAQCEQELQRRGLL